MPDAGKPRPLNPPTGPVEPRTDAQGAVFWRALANTATLAGRARAYMLWGIDGHSHEVIGTSFSPATSKRGNETFEAWLTQMLSQSASFEFHEVNIDGQTVIVLEIHSASWTPVSFRGAEYTRVGSTNRPLRNHPEKARALWNVLNQSHFEESVAAERMVKKCCPTSIIQAIFNWSEYPFPTVMRQSLMLWSRTD